MGVRTDLVLVCGVAGVGSALLRGDEQLADGESSHEVNYLLLFVDRVYPPVVHHEGELRHFGFCFGQFLALAEAVAHYGDEHVEKMNTHEETQADEEQG